MTPRSRGDDRPREPARDRALGEARRRRRRAEVFGEVLPERAAEDRGERWNEPETPGKAEEWLRREVPPHHG
jgi:hypothetical protein